MQIDFRTSVKFSFITLLFSITLWPLITMAYEPDLDNGEEVNELCAGCHGEYAQGSRDGEYPRLAGQPAAYISKQMHLFRDRKRHNIPMYEYVDERQFPDAEIADVSAYIATIELPTSLPPIDEDNFDPLERLLLTRKLLNIRLAPGDIKAGEKLYKKECRSCHGRGGWGDREDGIPMIAGQYTEYLQRMVQQFIKKVWIHDADDPDEEILSEFSTEELQNIFAYLSSTDD
ncbi:MAG TPA: c-type cytochrome [Ectothiorhodospiraceae bacterium]|nr:c-type cytochrome [Ectothiorhodospiraceae bacterium]